MPIVNTQVAERGDIAIYTSLIMVTIMLSGALALSLILSRQIPATLELQQSEQAFYAASSGVEQAFFEIIHNNASELRIEPGDAEIELSGNQNAAYFGQVVSLQGCITDEDDPDYSSSCVDGTPCGAMTGAVNGTRRRVARGVPEVDCPDTLLVGE